MSKSMDAWSIYVCRRLNLISKDEIRRGKENYCRHWRAVEGAENHLWPQWEGSESGHPGMGKRAESVFLQVWLRPPHNCSLSITRLGRVSSGGCRAGPASLTFHLMDRIILNHLRPPVSVELQLNSVCCTWGITPAVSRAIVGCVSKGNEHQKLCQWTSRLWYLGVRLNNN